MKLLHQNFLYILTIACYNLPPSYNSISILWLSYLNTFYILYSSFLWSSFNYFLSLAICFLSYFFNIYIFIFCSAAVYFNTSDFTRYLVSAASTSACSRSIRYTLVSLSILLAWQNLSNSCFLIICSLK